MIKTKLFYLHILITYSMFLFSCSESNVGTNADQQIEASNKSNPVSQGNLSL